MNNDQDNDCDIEIFYVYKELQTGKWNAVLAGISTNSLPTIAFGTRIFAANERDAICRAKKTYDEVHAYDSDKDNVRMFIASTYDSILKKFYTDNKYPNEDDIATISDLALKSAVKLNADYKKYFNKLEEEK